MTENEKIKSAPTKQPDKVAAMLYARSLSVKI